MITYILGVLASTYIFSWISNFLYKRGMSPFNEGWPTIVIAVLSIGWPIMLPLVSVGVVLMVGIEELRKNKGWK